MDTSEDSRIASMCFNAGIRFFKSHDYFAAKGAFKDAVVRDPTNSTALSMFRTAAVAFGRDGLGITMFDGSVVPLSPKAVCPFALGLSYLLDREFSLGLRYLAQALLLDYPNKELLFYFDSAASAYCTMLIASHNVQKMRATQPPPTPLKEPTFTCPICMAPFVEEMATKCGHIFCNKCIRTAITAQGKCPTCRRKVTAEELLRVFLPTSS